MRYLQVVSMYKVYNYILLQLSYAVSLFLRNPVVWGKPYFISIEPTTICNLGCPQCPSGLKLFSRHTGNLSLKFYKNTIDQLSRHLISLTLYFQGEPFINPHFIEFVKYAHQKGIYTITSSNAHYFSDETARRTVESGLDHLIISMDGTTQEIYENYRVKGNLEKVISGIKNMVKWKKQLNSPFPTIELQFIVSKVNYHQIPEIKRLSREWGVDKLSLKSMQIYDYEEASALIPENDKFSRYILNSEGKYVLKSQVPNKCFRMWSGNVITWDGLVIPCCFDKDAEHQLGDLKVSHFEDVWKNKRYNDFRKSIFLNRAQHEICRNCTQGIKTKKYLNKSQLQVK